VIGGVPVATVVSSGGAMSFAKNLWDRVFSRTPVSTPAPTPTPTPTSASVPTQVPTPVSKGTGPVQAMWKSADVDVPIVVTGILGTDPKTGKTFYSIEGSMSGVASDEIIWSTQKFSQTPAPTPTTTPVPIPTPVSTPFSMSIPTISTMPVPTRIPSLTITSTPIPTPTRIPTPVPVPTPTPTPTQIPTQVPTPVPPMIITPIQPKPIVLFPPIPSFGSGGGAATGGGRGYGLSDLGFWEFGDFYSGVHPLTGKLTKVKVSKKIRYGDVPRTIVRSRVSGSEVSSDVPYYKRRVTA